MRAALEASAHAHSVQNRGRAAGSGAAPPPLNDPSQPRPRPWGAPADMSGGTLLSDEEKRLIVGAFRLIVPVAETVADLFYARLFEDRPHYRKLFPDDMSGQKRKLIAMLSFITKSLDWTEEEWRDDVDPQDDLFLVVLALGRRHHDLYKIPEDSYEPVEVSLMWALDQGLGQAFTPELRRAWTKLYRSLATSMKIGAKASRIKMEFGRIT